MKDCFVISYESQDFMVSELTREQSKKTKKKAHFIKSVQGCELISLCPYLNFSFDPPILFTGCESANDTEINARLDSLVHSVTELALGSSGQCWPQILL